MKKKRSIKKSEFIQNALDQFTESVSAEASNRELGIRDARYENGDQWEQKEKTERANRPCLTVNKLTQVVKQIIGDARQNRPRIKVRPVDSASDPLTAEILTGLIRNIENVSDAEAAYDNGLECAARSYIGFWRVITQYSDDDVFDQEIVIERIVNPQAVYYDQASIKTDYSDADHCFVIEEMRRDKFKDEWPKADAKEWEKGEGESNSGWFSPDTVRVAEYWYKEKYTKHIYELETGEVIEIKSPRVENVPHAMTGEVLPHVIETDSGEDGTPMPFKRNRDVECKKVMFCKINGNQILEGPTEWPGKYIPIVPCLGEEVWIEGERILRSAIRFAIEPQKLYNWARSNNMETMALAPKQPWVLTAEQIKGYEELWNKAYASPMPYLLYNDVPGQQPPKRLMGSVGDQGANQDAMMSADDIKSTTGIYDASLGARGNETSGKAINARQRQGDTATFVFPDNQTRALKYTGKILVDLIPKIYDSERVVRLMGDDLAKKFSNNVPAVGGDPTVQVGQNGTEAWAKINIKDPMTGMVYNDLSIGKYDIVVDAGPGYATRRQEATDGMLMIGQAAPQALPILLPRIAKNQDWPDAQEIGDEIKAMSQPQGPSPKDQIDMQKGQLDLQGKQLDLQGKAADIQAKQQDSDQRIANVVLGILQQVGVIR